MSDPRASNCQAYHVNAAGIVDGVQLTVLPVAGTQYVCKSVTLIDEGAAQGQITAQILVYSADGLPLMSEKVYLAWPWDGSPNLPNKALPGNTNYPANHVIANGYTPPAQGPLAIYVGRADGSIDSDIVGGLGLPNNRHVSYNLMFQARGASTSEKPGCLAAILSWRPW